MKLKDKVVIITGAGQGIGKMYATKLAQEGAKIVIAEINLDNANAVAREIEGQGGDVLVVQTDVSDEKSTQKMADETVKAFDRIDVLINNAAIYYGIGFKPYDAISVEDWDRLMAVNVKGSWLCIKAVVPQMKKQKKGKIINVSSATWLMGIPYMLHYVTSKAAVVGMVRAISREIGEFGININAVSPGLTMTEASLTLPGQPPNLDKMISEQTAMKRNEQPEDLVGTIIFLSSDGSDFITGQLINVDGGWALH